MKTLYNVVLCYHGFVSELSQVLTFRTYIEDFKAQIQHLIDKGYKIVKLKDFLRWRKGEWIPDTPIVSIVFDDALASVSLATDWLVLNQLPFSVAIIGRRLCKKNPENDYMSWKDLELLIGSGYCELLHHTYNMHHLALRNNEGVIETSPILEGPCWIDNADFIYMDADETRWYWDYSFVDTNGWGFPLFGTDGNILVDSSITFKAKETITVNTLRLFK